MIFSTVEVVARISFTSTHVKNYKRDTKAMGDYSEKETNRYMI